MKFKNKLTIFVFFSIILGFFAINILTPDEIISKSERRNLAQLPSFENIGKISNDFENYTTDQFFKRDQFRTIKNYIELFVVRKKDIHSLSLYNDGIIKIESLNKNSVINATKKINEIYEKYLKEMKVYYTIVPDKSCYILNENYPTYNYKEIENIIVKNTDENIKYINIYNELNYDSYYKTDSHWKQEKIISVANKISKEITGEILNSGYDISSIKDFYGVYYGQLQLNSNPEIIYYLTNDEIEDSIVYNYETTKNTKVYDMQKINSIDKYDIFLSGATPILEITNNKVEKGEELIVFRDSFGSSLIPLLIEKYNKIVVIDLRYISSNLLEEYINFQNQEVLFMYSTMLYNNSFSLK